MAMALRRMSWKQYGCIDQQLNLGTQVSNCSDCSDGVDSDCSDDGDDDDDDDSDGDDGTDDGVDCYMML